MPCGVHPGGEGGEVVKSYGIFMPLASFNSVSHCEVMKPVIGLVTKKYLRVYLILWMDTFLNNVHICAV